jgi:DNA-binding NtrC family response regulator
MLETKLRILVIDDDEGITDSIARLLRTQNHTVTQMNDAGRALEYLESNPFDLVITDIIMFGTDGIEAIQAIRRQFPAMPVIAMSGGGCGFRPGCLQTAHMLGANETLDKPFEDAKLFETIERAMAWH